MKYNQPWGISDPNGSYVNGNPSTGTMGSIPPAASIEYPQRELVNFFTKSNFAPDNADLFQLGKSVQSGLVNWGVDVGSPNLIAITPTIPILSYQVGLRFIIKMTYGNTTKVQVNISGCGWVPIVHMDGSQINAWEIVAGQLIEIAFDGVNFQMLAGGTPMGGAVTLSAPRDLYINDITGDDTLYDGTSAAVSGPTGGPYKTIQKALATMQKYNLGGWSFNIHVADGTYTYPQTLILPLPNGSGTVNLIGNASNPAAVILNPQAGTCLKQTIGGNYTMQGFKVQAIGTVAPGDNGNGLDVAAGQMGITNCHFGNCTTTTLSAHMAASGNGSIFVGIGGTITIDGNAAYAHQWAIWNGKILNAPPTFGGPNLNVPGPVTIGAAGGGFGVVWDGAIVTFGYASITGKANVTGVRYYAMGNGIIDTGGGGATYLPGTVAGTLASGGQYL